MTDLMELLIIMAVLAALFVGLVYITKVHDDERFALPHTPNHSRDTIVQRLDRDRPIHQTHMAEI